MVVLENAVVREFMKAVQIVKDQASAYSKIGAENRTTLEIDARGDRVGITMKEYRFDTNRTTGISLVLTREEWELFKNKITENGGKL